MVALYLVSIFENYDTAWCQSQEVLNVVLPYYWVEIHTIHIQPLHLHCTVYIYTSQEVTH